MHPVITKNDTATSPTNKKYLFESVYAQTEFSTHYVYQLVFSTIITVLGLINNNNVVVIGAMLISPLFWPVMGIALGVITTRQNILKSALVSFFISVASVLLVSFLISVFLPLPELPDAIVSRISPNIIDLFIALAISTIGVLGLYYPTISSTATGVAISISLLPPLCIAGIGLAKGMFSLVWKSFLMFGTNMVAIVFMGVIVLYLLKIRPRKLEEEKRFRFGVLLSGIIMLIMSIPLSIYLKESVRQSAITAQVRNIMSAEVLKVDSTARVETLTVDFLSLNKKTPLTVSATVYLPENVYMTQSQREQLVDKLSVETGRTMNLNFNIINTVSLQTDEDTQRSAIKNSIREILAMSFVEYTDSIEVSNIYITFNASTEVEILIQVKQYGDIPIDYDYLTGLEEKLHSELGVDAKIDLELIPVNKLSDTKITQSSYRKIYDGFNNIFLEVSPYAELKNISVNDELVIVLVELPEDIEITEEEKSELETYVREILGETFSVQLRLQRFELK